MLPIDVDSSSPTMSTFHPASIQSLPRPEHLGVKKESMEIDELGGDGSEEEDDDPHAFRIRNVLPAPVTRTFTTQELHDLIHQGTIDLNPPYQRDVVWPETKQICLIDSLLKNYYIPPVVFTVEPDEEGELIRVCIDGKQRLTSIQKFFDGQIPHQDQETKKKWWWIAPESQRTTRALIPESQKVKIQAKMIQCVEYSRIAPGTERDIFQRVQLGISLTAAEKLKAIDSPWSEWIGDLKEKHIDAEQSLLQAFEWDTTRGRDFQAVAQLVYVCAMMPQEQTPSAAKIDKFLSRDDEPTPAFKSDIDQVLLELYDIACDASMNEGFKRIKQRVAPVEFVFIGVLLYKLRDSPMEDKARKIFEMRRQLRERHKDIRLNPTLAKTLWEFINEAYVNPTASFREKKVKRARRRNDSDDEYQP